jgi:hypothetical protein
VFELFLRMIIDRAAQIFSLDHIHCSKYPYTIGLPASISRHQPQLIIVTTFQRDRPSSIQFTAFSSRIKPRKRALLHSALNFPDRIFTSLQSTTINELLKNGKLLSMYTSVLRNRDCYRLSSVLILCSCYKRMSR